MWELNLRSNLIFFYLKNIDGSEIVTGDLFNRKL